MGRVINVYREPPSGYGYVVNVDALPPAVDPTGRKTVWYMFSRMLYDEFGEEPVTVKDIYAFMSNRYKMSLDDVETLLRGAAGEGFVRRVRRR